MKIVSTKNRKSLHEDIDFVIIWVDGNDPDWQELKKEYEGSMPHTGDDRSFRYRDWDNLRYWFRGVETFCPWVRKIHFVTWGHLPAWLNTAHPKLNIVKHEDYIPQKYLPTFSSHTIELNLHRIEGLSDNFVYFNDDMFILRPMEKTDFFRKGKPCDSAALHVHCYNMENMVMMSLFRDIGIINHEFRMHQVIRKNIPGWFNYKYGLCNLRTLVLLGCPRFPGMLQQHLPSSFAKGTYEEVWEKYPDVLDETCSHRFREIPDVNQWVFKEWQIASGNFYPRSIKIGKNLTADNIEDAADCIRQQKTGMLCLNDTEMSDERFSYCRDLVKDAFESILPETSLFELQ